MLQRNHRIVFSILQPPCHGQTDRMMDKGIFQEDRRIRGGTPHDTSKNFVDIIFSKWIRPSAEPTNYQEEEFSSMIILPNKNLDHPLEE